MSSARHPATQDTVLAYDLRNFGHSGVANYAERASSGTRYCPLTVPSPVTRL